MAVRILPAHQSCSFQFPSGSPPYALHSCTCARLLVRIIETYSPSPPKAIMSRFLVRAVLILTALMMLRAEFVLHAANKGSMGGDFWAYFTGAWVVRSGSTLDLYKAAPENVDASDVVIDPKVAPEADSNYVQTAQAHSIPVGGLYIYPPTLADLMTPLTLLSPKAALRVWYALSFAALIGAGVLIARLIGIKSVSHALPVLAGLMIFPPVFDCLTWGQVPLILLFIIVAAIALLVEGKRQSSALLFALAAAIKLTPLVVLLPLLAWREWKAVQAVTFWGLAILFALLAINGTGWLNLYFLHETPTLGAVLDFQNRSLGTVFHLLSIESGKAWSVSLAGISGNQPQQALFLWLGRALSVAAIGVACWLTCISAKTVKATDKVETIAAFLLIVCCIAPVSWLRRRWRSAVSRYGNERCSTGRRYCLYASSVPFRFSGLTR
jgi:hypothetical protein